MTELPCLRRSAGRLFLRVRASPGASRDGIVGIHGDLLKIQVTAAPEKGKANRAIVLVLSKVLGIRKTSIVIVSGESSRNKNFELLAGEEGKIRAAIEREISKEEG